MKRKVNERERKWNERGKKMKRKAMDRRGGKRKKEKELEIR